MCVMVLFLSISGITMTANQDLVIIQAKLNSGETATTVSLKYTANYFVT